MSDLPFVEPLRDEINGALNRFLPKSDTRPDRLHEAMRYSVLSGGKRLRPILTLLAGDIVSDDRSSLLNVACSVEFIHAYSLIHDDLPSMDDDDMRRGVPSCHRKFDEATAILAGDALQALAFETLSDLDDSFPVSTLLNELSTASGSTKLVGGQQLDLIREEEGGTIEQLKDLHSRKTGALITAALRMGMIAGGGSNRQVQKITEAGNAMGLAFQITDDILDVEGSDEDLGKTAGKDEKSGKLTYPSLMGLETSHELAQKQMGNALEALSDFDHGADRLKKITKFIVERDH